MRKPIFSGQFYPHDKTALEEEVKSYLSRKKENVKACIVPHAGYMFSGKLAGEVLGKINEKKDFILLGVNHSNSGSKISFSQQDFETPLGLIKNNLALSNKIIKKMTKQNLDANVDEQAHAYEHSIEVQLPFLQLSQKKFEIVPILLKDLSYDECKKLAEILAEFIDESICLIVSSDFTHYGCNYNFIPFTKDIRKNLYYLDNSVITEILNLNSKKVYELAGKSTICGIYGITIITEIAKIKKFKARLVGYYTSGDVVNDYSNAVGYAGIVFS